MHESELPRPCGNAPAKKKQKTESHLWTCDPDCPVLSGHLTCTNKRAQAAEQKIARNESFLALPAMHPLCVCSMLVPSEFSHLRKRSAKKLHFCTFLGNCRISESAKKLQKLFGSALSHLIICCFSDFGSGDCSGGAQDAEMAFWLCTFVGAH